MNLPNLPGHEYRRLAAVAESSEQLEELVRRRVAGEPLQYLEGVVQFGPIELHVDRRVLIPRPETEHLASELVRTLTPPRIVVDLGTGSGAVALFLKHAWPTARVIGTDVSSDALSVAQGNGSGVEWMEGDLFDALPADLLGSIDLLVTNPPYVAESEWGRLPRDVRHEPRAALVAGPKGTEIVERILAEIPRWLAPDGVGWIEIGEAQAWLREHYPVEVVKDQYGVDRFLRWT